MTTTNNNDNHIVPVGLAIKAMADGSYKNMAYALAELMDNSIEAKASNVELVCIESQKNVNGKQMQQIDQIVVADDGKGMDKELLYKALQIGFGSRLLEKKQTGMGRFGVGLPLASIGQANLVEVWSWAEGSYSDAYYQYLDVNEVITGSQTEFKQPVKKAIPKHILKNLKSVEKKSGTIILWSKLTNPKWVTGEAILRNSEQPISRMYRYFIDDNSVAIRLVNVNAQGSITEDRLAKPNDPLYLMKNSSTPEPWAIKPMFTTHRDETFDMKSADGQVHQVKIRSSVASAEARKGDAAGSQPYGLHAKKNVGISVLRAGREIELVSTNIKQDPTERWWGLEFDFPRPLDDIFEISNDKQSAKAFKNLWDEEEKELREEQRQHDDSHPFYQLVELIIVIKNTLNELRKEVSSVKSARRKTRKRNIPEAERPATEITDKETKKGDSDKEIKEIPLDERIKKIQETLIKKGYDKVAAEEMATFIKDENLKYMTTVTDMNSPDFFNTESVAGVLEVALNQNHKAFMFLDMLVKQDEIDDMSEEDLKKKLHDTVFGIKLVLYAWARLRDQASPDEKEQMDDIRVDWGKKTKNFFGNNG